MVSSEESRALSVEVRGITKRFGRTIALNEVNVTLAAGSIHGLVGPNGSGKSTLVKLLVGMEQPDSGDIVFDDEVVKMRSLSDVRGYGVEVIPQELCLVQDMTIWENMTLGHEPRRGGRLDVSACKRRTRNCLAQLDLDIDVYRTVNTLGPAIQRMIMVACTLDRGVRLLVADEPTAGLPPEQAESVLTALRSVSDRGVTVLFVSHHLDEVVDLCASATVLIDGHVTKQVTGVELHRQSLIEALLNAENAKSYSRSDDRSVADAEPVLKVSNLQGENLRDLSFSARKGEVVGIAGLLGSGRDTAIDLIVGSKTRTNGEVTVNSQRISDPAGAVVAGVGYVSGDRSVAAIPDWNVAEHISLASLKRWRRHLTVDVRRETAAAAEAMAYLQIKGSAKDEFSGLSGGNQQRALFARWIGSEIKVLLVDEPCVGVDVNSRAALLAHLRESAADRAVIVGSSDPNDLVEACDRVVCMYRGTVVDELVAPNITERQILASITNPGTDEAR